MRMFVEKPRATQQTTARKATGPIQSKFGMVHTRTKEVGAGLSGTALPHLGHDFARIPVSPPKAGALQTKLAINKPGNEHEQEADRVAEQVMHMPTPPLRASTIWWSC